jgi:hypothetical protein
MRLDAWIITAFGRSYDLRVMVGLVLVAVILGVLNNMRVYEEQRVPWLGFDAGEEAE